MTAAASPAHLPLPNELIILAEAQWLFSESDLLHTPSIIAGLTPTQERENRAKGVNFIVQVGIMLKLPQITLATASVFLHRFFMRYSMIEDRVAGRQHQHYYSIAATCLFLATKVEENCRKMKDLVVACVRVAQKQPNKEVDEQDKEFWRWRDVLLQLEDLLLEALCFDLSLESPYKSLYSFLVHFQEENNRPLRDAAWGFVNDSCLTPLCLLYPARTIAAAAIYAAARHCGVKLSDDEQGRPWWEVAGSDLTSIRKACNYMASLYENVSTSRTNGETGKNAIYQHTPEASGEERFAKTRAFRPGTSPQDSRQSTPLSGPLNHTQPLQSSRDIHDNGVCEEEKSTAGSIQSRKRHRGTTASSPDEGEISQQNSAEEGEIPWGGHESDSEKGAESQRKRQRTNSISNTNNDAPRQNGTSRNTNGQTQSQSQSQSQSRHSRSRMEIDGPAPSRSDSRSVTISGGGRTPVADVDMGGSAGAAEDEEGNGSEEGEL